MLDCLTDYIGLSSSVRTSESGLYLDAFPGINLFNILKIADEHSIEKVYEDVQRRSIAKFRTFFITEFNRCFKLYKREAVDCLICENKELLAIALWYLTGAELCEEFLRSDRINRYTGVDRKSVKENKDNLTDAFFSELATSIAGIDIESSTCFEEGDNPECNSSVTFVQVCP